MVVLLALLIGVVAGLRTMTAPAAIAWAAYLGWLNLSASWLWFMGTTWAVGIFTILAIVELVIDQLPSTPSRKAPQPFGARLIMGALTGLAIGTPHGPWIVGLIAGVVGAAIGAYGGAAVRTKLAASFGKDMPAAFIEDAVAIIGGYLIIAALPAAVVAA
jgi:uncharacterized membrane protein